MIRFEALPWLAAAAGTLALAAAFQGPPPSEQGPAARLPGAPAVEAFLQKRIRLDLDHGWCAIPATVGVRDDLLEYVLILPRGAAHESLLQTDVGAVDLNAALLALGVEPGHNARWIPIDPQPTLEEVRAGAATHDVEPPQGDGFYLYVGWRSEGETYLYRLEDLLRNLETGQAMKRHRWVYLGSRWVRMRQDGSEAFGAELDGNLINLAFFEQGTTLLTSALPECLKQTIWLPNAWLLPPRGETVMLVFARERLASLPATLEAQLPEIGSGETAAARSAEGEAR